MNKVMAITPWPIVEKSFGGAERCRNLLYSLSDLSILYPYSEIDSINIKKHLGIDHIEVPLNESYKDEMERLSKIKKIPMDDLWFSILKKQFLNIKSEIKKRNPSLIILEHPWLVDFVLDKNFIYSSHNCEARIAEERFGSNSFLFKLVYSLEKASLLNCSGLIYTSENDLDDFKKYYNIEINNKILIKNGIKTFELKKREIKNKIIFIGSLHQPNVIGARRMAELASLMPEYSFEIIGAVSSKVSSDLDNFVCHGEVSEEKMQKIISESFAMCNLIDTGSGTNLKNARVMAQGVPVIASKKGSRGYQNIIIANSNEEVVASIKHLEKNYKQHSEEALAEARLLDWKNIVPDYVDFINKFL